MHKSADEDIITCTQIDIKYLFQNRNHMAKNTQDRNIPYPTKMIFITQDRVYIQW